MNNILFKTHTHFSKTTLAYPVENYSLKKEIEGGEKMMNKSKNKGFTLIELLIVIVIIGILAGVLIALIDPQTQQNRAKDANVQAALNKTALAVGGYISAYGDVPDGPQFASSLANITIVSGCTPPGDTGSDQCTFYYTNSPVASLCASLNEVLPPVDGSGTAQCAVQYIRDDTTNPNNVTWDLIAASYGSKGYVYSYRSEDSRLYLCPSNEALTCTNAVGN